MRAAHPLLDHMRGNVDGVAWPQVIEGHDGSVAALLRQLDRTQWLAPEELAAAQFEQLRILTRHLAATSPHFGRRLHDAGLSADDVATPEGLLALPPLLRRDVQDAGDDLFATEVPAGHNPVSVGRSSGSTGEPVTVRRTVVNGLVWSALTLRDHLWRGIDFRGRLASCRMHPEGVDPRPSWGHPVAPLFESGPSLTIPVTVPVNTIARLVVDFDPHVLQIYPSVLDPLVELVVDQRLALPRLEFVHTTGEPLVSDTRTRTIAELGVAIWDSYTAEEVGNIAFECPDAGNYHVNAEALIVEILDHRDQPCAEGEQGRVVITDLQNFATPLVRCDLGDYAEVGGPCPCGRGLPTVRRILGRERNLVRLPDGSRHWPTLGQLPFRELAPIRQFRFVQTELEAIEVDMVVDRAVTAAEEAALTDMIQGALGHPFVLRFAWWGEPLPRQPGGKFEQFRCEV